MLPASPARMTSNRNAPGITDATSTHCVEAKTPSGNVGGESVISLEKSTMTTRHFGSVGVGKRVYLALADNIANSSRLSMKPSRLRRFECSAPRWTKTQPTAKRKMSSVRYRTQSCSNKRTGSHHEFVKGLA